MLLRNLTSCSVRCYYGLVLNKQNPTGFSLLLPLLNSIFTFLAFLHPLCWASPLQQRVTCLTQASASSLDATNATLRGAPRTDTFYFVNSMFCALDF